MLATETYVRRRQRLSEQLGSGLVLMLGHDDTPMNFRDNPYPFRQDGSFLYYFGIDRPRLTGLLDLDEDRGFLFGHEPTLDEIVWTGPEPTLSELGASVGVDDCRPTAALREQLSAALGAGRTVHFLPPYRDSSILELARLLEIPSTDVSKCASRELIEAVVAQRSIKSDSEVAEIEQALELAREIHVLAMRMARPGIREQEVVGAIEGLLVAKGSATAFPVIFSVRSEVLHNHRYDNVMQSGELAILDAGALSPSRYASDITRTFPVGRDFSTRQREVYEIVLDAQQSAIRALAPGVPFEQIHLRASQRLAEGLAGLGLMRGDLEAAVEQGAHALFFPHGLGHMLGLDVHDLESLGEDFVGYDETVSRSSQFGRKYLRLAKSLQAGHVLTVEPGLYFISQLIDRWASEERFGEFIDYSKLEDWRGFGGVRIEDNVLVTEEGCRLLGKPIPRSVAEIEELTTK